jgi:hypothetical protein
MPQITAVKLSDSLPINIVADDDGNLYVALGTELAGERRRGDAAATYIDVKWSHNLTIIQSLTAVTLGAGAQNDTYLGKIIIKTALTGDLVITGFIDDTGVARTITFTTPAAQTIYFDDAINAAGALTLTVANAADPGKVLAFWRPK